jgi:CHAT domain-containing protein/tetratricopeptide (TPR) repeat protein
MPLAYNDDVRWCAAFLLLIPAILHAQDLMKDLDQAEVWMRSSEYQKANDAARKVASEAKRIKDDRALARAFYIIGDAQYYLGTISEFKRAAEQALDAYLKINDAEGIAKSYYQLSFVYQHDAPDEMVHLLDQANAYAAKTKTLWLHAVIENAYGIAYQNLGSYRKAASHYEQSAKIAEKDADGPKQAIALSNAALNYSYLGNYQIALHYLDHALSIAKQANNKRAIAVVLGHRGVTQLTLGDTDDALSCFNDALAIYVQSGYLKGQLTQTQNIADVYSQLQDSESFLKYSKQALSISEQIGSENSSFYTLIRVAEFLIDEDRLIEAQAYINRARAIALKTNVRNRIRMTDITDSMLQLKLRKFNKAHQSIDEALLIAKQDEDAYALGRVFNMKARIYEAEGKVAEATNAFHNAFDVYEPMGILQDLAFWSGKIAALNVKAGNEIDAKNYYEKALSYVDQLDSILIMDRFRINLFKDVSDIYQSYARWLALKGSTQQAWEILEQGRTRDLALRIAQAQETSLTDQERDALGRVTNLQKSLREEELSKSDRINLLEKLSTAEAQYEQATFAAEKTKQKTRTHYSLSFPQRNCLYIEYATFEDEIFVFSSLNGSTNFRKISPATPVLEKAIAFHQQTSRFENQFDPQLSQELYKVLLEPELVKWPEGRIVFIPDDVLNFVPYSALQSKDQYVAEHHAVSTVPSLEILNLLNSRKHNSESKVAAVANTTFRFAKKSPFPLPELPGTEKEMKMVVETISGSIPMLNKSESQIKAHDFSHFKMMHLATHTLINEAYPERSCVVLNGDAKDDGYLQAREIYRMRLPDIVVLSGCRSGTGKIVSGEGLVGLSHAFFAARTRTLLTSLWDVSDEGTVQFMSAFYSDAANHSAVEALQHAQITLIHSRKWNHPVYWSGFSISGVADENMNLRRNFAYASVFYYSGIAAAFLAFVYVVRKSLSRR